MSDITEKIGKLLRLAENAGTVEEANTYTEKAQSLASANSIDLAKARAAVAHRENREEPEQKTVWFGDMATKNLKKHLVELYCVIARSNDLKINCYQDSTGVILFGFPSDMEVAELLFGSLASQMVESANAYLSTGAYKTETVWSDTTWTRKPVDGRTARASFYSGFIATISTRLNKARKEARAAAVAADAPVVEEGVVHDPLQESVGTALVLVQKDEEVRSFYHANTRAKGSYHGPSGAHSASGYNSGRTAGSNARVGAQRAIGGAKTGITS